MHSVNNPGNTFNTELVDDLTGYLRLSDNELAECGLSRSVLKRQLADLDSELQADIGRERRHKLAELIADNYEYLG